MISSQIGGRWGDYGEEEGWSAANERQGDENSFHTTTISRAQSDSNEKRVFRLDRRNQAIGAHLRYI